MENEQTPWELYFQVLQHTNFHMHIQFFPQFTSNTEGTSCFSAVAIHRSLEKNTANVTCHEINPECYQNGQEFGPLSLEKRGIHRPMTKCKEKVSKRFCFLKEQSLLQKRSNHYNLHSLRICDSTQFVQHYTVTSSNCASIYNSQCNHLC